MKRTILLALPLLLSNIATADVKLTNHVTSPGQTFDTTVMMKGSKVRTEASVGDKSLVEIQDCEHHQATAVDQSSKSFALSDLDERPIDERETRSSTAAIVVMKVNEQDTGERKKFFGYTARHLKGTVTARGGEGACRVDSNITLDGWYIQPPEGEGCSPAERQILRQQILSGLPKDCSERFTVSTSGVEDVGYPVVLDMTFAGGAHPTTVHQETTSISTDALDPNLFDVPAAYTRGGDYSDLMWTALVLTHGSPPVSGPNFPPVTNGGVNENANGVVAGATQTTTDKQKKVLTIGIAQLTTTADQELSVDGLQQELANDINFLGAKAVIIAADPNDRDAVSEQARQHGCDYVVYTNIVNFRTASVGQKLGRVFNRGGIGGVGGSEQGRVQIDAEVKVFQPEKETPVLDGAVNFRQNDADATARGLMHTEARTVMLQLKNLQAAK